MTKIGLVLFSVSSTALKLQKCSQYQRNTNTFAYVVGSKGMFGANNQVHRGQMVVFEKDVEHVVIEGSKEEREKPI